VTDYGYNALGERIYKSGQRGSYHYLHGSGQLLVETDALGNTLKNYVYLNGQRLALQATQAGNDGFESAYAITEGSARYSVNTQGLTAQSCEPAHAGHTASHSTWFSLTPSIDDSYVIDTQGSEFDTVLAVYTGSDLCSLSELASNDDASGTHSQVRVELQAGQTYYIAVDGKAGAAGLVQLNLYSWAFTLEESEVPFLPLWALALLGSGLIGLAARHGRGKPMLIGLIALSPLVANDTGKALQADDPIQAVDVVSQWYYIHSDHLDTPQRITDQSQAVVWEAYYKPFGEAVITTEGIENNLRFPGQYFDGETGLHYNYFRDYDPRTGRYLQSDPIGLDGGINTYAYADGKPTSVADQYGLKGVGGTKSIPNPYNI
jgi:RHS repeat-associated protein